MSKPLRSADLPAIRKVLLEFRKDPNWQRLDEVLREPRTRDGSPVPNSNPINLPRADLPPQLMALLIDLWTLGGTAAAPVKGIALAERVIELIDRELQPADEDKWLPAELPSDCAKQLGMSLDTLKRYENAGKIRIDKITQKRWRIHARDAAKFRPDA